MERRYIPNAFSPTMRLASNQARVAAALSGVRGLGTGPSDAGYTASPTVSTAAIQCALNHHAVPVGGATAYTPLSTDGKWGNNTSRALESFRIALIASAPTLAEGDALVSATGGRAVFASALATSVTLPSALKDALFAGAAACVTATGDAPPRRTPARHSDTPPAVLPPVVESKTDMTTWLLAGAAAVAVGVGAWLFLKKKGR